MDLYEKMAKQIRNHGRSVINVMDDPPFTYSIGNAIAGLPELIVFGLHPQDATPLLNVWSRIMVDRGAAFTDCELIDIGGRFPCMAGLCADHVRLDYTFQAGQFLGREDYPVVQIIVPDKSGRFPPDPLCDPAFSRAPVLRRLPQ